jgi:hypothetical protein
MTCSLFLAWCCEENVPSLLPAVLSNYLPQYWKVLEISNLSVLNDTDASFVAIAIALCLKKKMKICCWTKERYK